MTTPQQRLDRMRKSFEKNKSVLTEDYKYFITPDKPGKQPMKQSDEKPANVSQPDKHGTFQYRRTKMAASASSSMVERSNMFSTIPKHWKTRWIWSPWAATFSLSRVATTGWGTASTSSAPNFFSAHSLTRMDSRLNICSPAKAGCEVVGTVCQIPRRSASEWNSSIIIPRTCSSKLNGCAKLKSLRLPRNNQTIPSHGPAKPHHPQHRLVNRPAHS
jgi:hypothetical protein